MPKLTVNKSITIKAPREKVFDVISNFTTWTSWSPWLIAEPDAKVTIAENAKQYSWEGKITGAGEMQITSEQQNESVDIALTFLKPWKSTAKVRFEIKQAGEEVEVSWLMDSSLPFFMFWMTKLMTAMIGMDYERGLNLLKDYVEDGQVHSNLEFIGATEYPGCTYIGIKGQCSLDDVTEVMEKDFGKLWAFCHEGSTPSGEPFTIYHHWNVVKRQMKYTLGVPVQEIPKGLPAEFITGTIPSTSAYMTRHTGPYRHLGNAWSSMYMFQRAKLFKFNKKIDPFETYANDPGEVSENELITNVYFATR